MGGEVGWGKQLSGIWHSYISLSPTPLNFLPFPPKLLATSAFILKLSAESLNAQELHLLNSKDA